MKYFLAAIGVLTWVASTGQAYGLFNQDYPLWRGLLLQFVWAGMALVWVYPDLEKRKRTWEE